MDRIRVAGAELAALCLGGGEKTPVVMLHGLATGNMAVWYSTAAASLAAERRVILYDQRGHGDSSVAHSGFDLDQQASDLSAVLAHYGLSEQRVDLVGHSMGALIALHFALNAAARVRQLVLVDAPMPAADYVAPSLLALHDEIRLKEYIATQFSPADGGRGRRRQRLQQRLASLLFSSSMVADVRAMNAEPDEAMQAYQQPVLLVYGRQSPCAGSAAQLQRNLPMAQTRWVDCGHYIPSESPELLRIAIRDFLDAANPISWSE